VRQGLTQKDTDMRTALDIIKDRKMERFGKNVIAGSHLKEERKVSRRKDACLPCGG